MTLTKWLWASSFEQSDLQFQCLAFYLCFDWPSSYNIIRIWYSQKNAISNKVKPLETVTATTSVDTTTHDLCIYLNDCGAPFTSDAPDTNGDQFFLSFFFQFDSRFLKYDIVFLKTTFCKFISASNWYLLRASHSWGRRGCPDSPRPALGRHERGWCDSRCGPEWDLGPDDNCCWPFKTSEPPATICLMDWWF